MSNNFDWGDSTLSGVKGSDLRLVRTSPHIDRWESDGSGSLVIKAREDSETYSRSTTHFTLNSTVQDHSSGTFSGGRYATVSSLSSAADHNIVSGIGTVDTWMLPTDGKITLPGATLFAPEGEELPERFQGLNTIRYAPDQDASKNYANLTSAIEADFKKNSLPIFDVGAYGWQGAKQPTKEELSKISSLVGSNTILPSIHFGSPDESMENLISDVLKLKQYTIGDVFTPTENSPMQQLDELNSRLSSELDSVHPKARGMYEEKFNKSYAGTKAEVDKWLDKKFPKNIGDLKSPPPPIPGSIIPPPVPASMPVDTALDMVGKSSEFTPTSAALKGKYVNEINQMHSKGLLSDISDSYGIASRLWDGESLGSIEKDYKAKQIKRTVIDSDQVTHQAVDKKAQSGVNTKTSTINNHKQVHKEIKENSIKNFFGDSRLTSFDTETTGLDNTNTNYSKRSKIWQVGLAIEGVSGVEEHTSPFFSSSADGSLRKSVKMARPFVESSLKHSNGQFSQKAFEQGNFKTLIDMYDKNILPSLETSLNNTLGKLNSSDVVVLQNMNFENSILKSSVEQGILSPDLYKSIADRMHTVDLDKNGDVNTLFQRPRSVQEEVRKADFIYNTDYLRSNSEESFQLYRGHLNQAMTNYKNIINDVDRQGIVAVELQDITKTFFANAADKGFIDKKTATLGLNMDFLTKTILGEVEEHTALSDANQTIDLFKSIWKMNEEVESGVVGKETRTVLDAIKQQQPEEINKRFIGTVRSVLNDFNSEKKSTRIGDSFSWYNPQVKLREKTKDGFTVTKPLEAMKTTSKKPEYSVVNALNDVISRYSKYEDNLNGFDRKSYVASLQDLHSAGVDTKSLFKQVDTDYFSPKVPSSNTNQNVVSKQAQNSIPKDTGSYWDETTTLFNKEMKRKTKATAIGVLGAGLAYMAFQSRPAEQQDNYDNVSQNFYDQQYLGTAFVDFKERNKHYMM